MLAPAFTPGLRNRGKNGNARLRVFSLQWLEPEVSQRRSRQLKLQREGP
jgi:hypothetical protein